MNIYAGFAPKERGKEERREGGGREREEGRRERKRKGGRRERERKGGRRERERGRVVEEGGNHKQVTTSEVN